MAARRRIDPVAGRGALETWSADPDRVPSDVLALAVRFTLEELGLRFPGKAVEVRVPPFGAVQCLPGVRHTRGTPPNVIETDPATWLALATGTLSWAQAVSSERFSATGNKADLSSLLPLQAPGAPGANPRDRVSDQGA